MVLAGPGSGKTFVITHRIKYLIEGSGINPAHILVVTFSRAAAKEMKDRFEKLCSKSLVTFGTFHSVFFNLLKTAYGFSSEQIASDELRYTLIKELIKRNSIENEDINTLAGNLLNEIALVKQDNISIKNSSQDFDLTFHSEKWWLVLNDSSLNHLIELVLKNNKSLQIAKLNIKKSEEAINLSKSSKNLDISFRSGLTRIETRENPLKNLTGKDNYSLYNIGLQTSYEFDLFDKFDNSIKEKEYQKIAVDASSKLAELTLEYQTFKLYACYLYLNEERSNLEDRKALLEKLYSMEKIGVEIGKSLEDNVLVIKEMLVGVNILLNKNEENINLVKNNLYLLVGTTSSIEVDNILNNTKNKDFKKLSSKIIIPSSVQSDIIINRPNVQYYLALIEAQDSKIKSLKANFYPSFSITGLLSYKSLKFP